MSRFKWTLVAMFVAALAVLAPYIGLGIREDFLGYRLLGLSRSKVFYVAIAAGVLSILFPLIRTALPVIWTRLRAAAVSIASSSIRVMRAGLSWLFRAVTRWWLARRAVRVHFPITKWHWMALACLYLAGLALNSFDLLPTYGPVPGGISPWDEIVYIGSGKDLVVDGSWFPYGRGPLISFLYAIIYLIVGHAENWVLVSSVVGRVISYSLIFLSMWLVGRELQYRRLSHPLVVVGVLTALPVYHIEFTAPSYHLFVALGCLAFWGLMAYFRTRSLLTLAMAGILVSLTTMVRPDGVMMATFVFLAALNASSLTSLASILAVAIAPLVIVDGGYIWLDAHVTGVFYFGGGERLYQMFETSYQLLMNTKGLLDFQAAENALRGARQVFGTPEENHFSVISAIARNPVVFAKMVWANTTTMTIPNLYDAYGVHRPFLSLVVGFLSLRGLVELARKKEWRLLALTVCWLSELGIYLLTMSFTGYLVYPFYDILALVAVGLSAGTANLNSRPERLAWVFALAITAWMGFDTGLPALAFLGGGVVLLIVATVRPALCAQRSGLTAAAVIFGILIVDWPTQLRFEWPDPPNEPPNGYEQQAAFLREHFPAGTRVLEFPGYAAVEAKMHWLPVSIDMRSLTDSPGALRAFLKQFGVRAVLVDPLFTDDNPWDVWAELRENGTHMLEPVFQSKDGKFAILAVENVETAR